MDLTHIFDVCHPLCLATVSIAGCNSGIDLLSTHSPVIACLASRPSASACLSAWRTKGAAAEVAASAGESRERRGEKRELKLK